MSDTSEIQREKIWTSEVVERILGWVVLIYKNNQCVGQLDLDNQKDTEIWQKIIEEMNPPIVKMTVT